jgi:hypothetical protein
MSQVIFQAPDVESRVNNIVYLFRGEKRMWLGKRWGCEHGKITYCKPCNIGCCEHKNLARRCKKCNTGYCIHNRDKYRCIDCNVGYCQHKRPKGKCKDCNTGYCEHGRDKIRCKECGTNHCVHKKFDGTCHLCHIKTHPKNFCKNCEYVNIRGNHNAYKPYCFRCHCYLNPDKIPRRFMMKENYIDKFLKVAFPNIVIIHNKIV